MWQKGIKEGSKLKFWGAVFLVLLSAGILFVAYSFAKKEGLFYDYPDAEYLTREEAESRPVYGLLSKNEQAVYTALYRGIIDMKTDIPMPGDIDGELYSRVYQIVEKQEPELFYLDSIYYTAEKVREAKVVFRETGGIEDKKKELDSAVEKALALLPYGDDYDKALYINDYLARNCTYVVGRDGGYPATAYGCLVEGKANCEGYAKAFRLLASEAGIRCAVVIGVTSEGENHAWDQVEIGGDWYEVDATWDDTDDENVVRRMYFLCDDEYFSMTHTADDTLFAPFSCENDRENYYVRNGLYVSEEGQAGEILAREFSAGISTIDLRFADRELYDLFKERYIENEEIFDVLRETGRFTAPSVSLTLEESAEALCLTIRL